MAFGSGRDSRMYMSGWDLSAYLTSLDMTVNGDALETTVFASSGIKEYIPSGLVDASMSGDGLFDGSATSVDTLLNNAIASSTQQVWSSWPQGGTTGNFGWGMHTLETTYKLTSPVDGVVSMSIEAQSKIGRDRMVSLRSLSAASTSGANASNDNTAASTKGGVGYLQRTSTGTKTVTCIIQHSSAATAWASLVTFTASTGHNGQRVAVSGSVKRYLRSSHTLSTGGTGTPTFQVGFSRK